MKNFKPYLQSNWTRMGILTLALSSTLSITPSHRVDLEHRSFSLTEAQESEATKKVEAEKITGQIQQLNNQSPSFSNATEVKRIEIATENGILSVLLEKSKTGQILAVVPWNQTEGDACVDNTCSDRKSFQLDSSFEDLKNKSEADIQVQILKEIKKSKKAKTEKQEEKKEEVQKIDSSIRENILPPNKTDLTAGGKLLAKAVQSCKDSDFKLTCHHEEFLKILKGDHKPSVAEALNFYNYMEEDILKNLTAQPKRSWYSILTGDFSSKTRGKGLEIIQDLLARIPAGFLPLREAVVYTLEKSIYSATSQYVQKFSTARSEKDIYEAQDYYSSILNPLRKNNPTVLFNGLNFAQQRDYISLGLANGLRNHYNQFSTSLWKSFDQYDQYMVSPQTQQSWISQLAQPLPPLDLSKYQIPVDYQTIQLLPPPSSIQTQIPVQGNIQSQQFQQRSGTISVSTPNYAPTAPAGAPTSNFGNGNTGFMNLRNAGRGR